MNKILITGSIAYDQLMTYPGLFKNKFLIDQLDNFSISLIAEDQQTFFGGCATNMAYSLKLLGEEPIVWGIAGSDFELYEKWLKEKEISTENILVDEKDLTAKAQILTDQNGCQFAIFIPGAMKTGKIELDLKFENFEEIKCAILGPEYLPRMEYYASFFRRHNIRYLLDPGQTAPNFEADKLLDLIDGSFGLIANAYEMEIISRKINLDYFELAKRAGFLVRTLGENGCELYVENQSFKIPVTEGVNVVDPTGCGDGFRAGFLHAYVNGKPLEECCKRGNKIAGYVLGFKGTQNHSIN